MDTKIQINNFSNQIWKSTLDETWEKVSRLTKDLELFKKYLEEERNIAENEEKPQRVILLLSIIDLHQKLLEMYFASIKRASSRLVIC